MFDHVPDRPVEVVAHATVVHAVAQHSVCRTARCRERVAIRLCSNRSPKWCVERAILTYKLSSWKAQWMRRIPGCESGWNPLAYNPSGATGLFQFMVGTWRGTPYGSLPITQAKWNALAAAWMLRQGRSGEWECR